MNTQIIKPNYKISNLNPVSALFLIVTPVISLLVMPIYFYFNDMSWGIFFSMLFYLFFNNFCITAGYHRLYSHKSYQAKPWVQILLLFFGAGAFQNSVLRWASDHRLHHKDVDTNDDPYAITKGTFYAHFGWMLLKDQNEPVYAKDLQLNKWVMIQHKYYLPIAIVSGFVLPMIWGWMLGDMWGGLLFVGLIRMVLGHHTTFLVNSLCHISGKRPYSLKHSAKDNLLVAFLTNGEGYHNFHHTFEADYRNGAFWYQWDPTKWAISFMAWFGQTYKLRKTSKEAILRSKLITQKSQLIDKGVDTTKLQQLQEQIDSVIQKINELKRDYEDLKLEYKKKARHWEANSRIKAQQLKADLAVARIELDNRLEQWKIYVSMLNSSPAW
jgi:stearoyl-CoA desaturase (delta-9 desaturase)